VLLPENGLLQVILILQLITVFVLVPVLLVVQAHLVVLQVHQVDHRQVDLQVQDRLVNVVYSSVLVMLIVEHTIKMEHIIADHHIHLLKLVVVLLICFGRKFLLVVLGRGLLQVQKVSRMDMLTVFTMRHFHHKEV
jgi:hypothetical protein